MDDQSRIALEAWIKYSITNYSGDGMEALSLTAGAFGPARYRQIVEGFKTMWACDKCGYTCPDPGGSSKCPECFGTKKGKLVKKAGA